MRLSELSGKEIVDMNNGERMGIVGNSDLEINPVTGEIHSIIMPESSFWGFTKKKNNVVIPWKAVYKIGPDMVIVSLGGRHNQLAGRE